MYEGKRILAFIPARGGSKGIPHKNITPLAGKPLIQYTIDAAKQSRYIDYVLVSTDDEEIATVARRCGAEVPFLRPPELAADTAKTIDAVLHAIETLREAGETFDSLVLLQPTSPLRTAEDIDKAVETFYESNRQPVVSVSEVSDHPILIRTIEDGRLKPLLQTGSTVRRQDMPPFYRVNGSIYINPIEEISQTTSFNDNPVPFIMQKSHSVDIDEPLDLKIAEWIEEAQSQQWITGTRSA
jgi:CMP-N-acetylneuraminic acid synthetase